MIELWSGTGSMAKAFEELGYDTLTLDFDPKHEADIISDIMNYDRGRMIDEGWLSLDDEVHFVWASPECTYFSKAQPFPHFVEREPVTPEAFKALEMVEHTLDIIESFNTLWMLENPLGMLRFQPLMRQYPRRTVDYCSYGHPNRKPTDLWGAFPANWNPRSKCSHLRHDKTDYQNGTPTSRAAIPEELCREIARAVDESDGMTSWRKLAEWI